MKRFIAIAALAFAPMAHAGTGNDLLSECTSKTEAKVGMCIGYIDGVIDTHPGICPPKGATLRQAVDLVVKRIQANPVSRHVAQHMHVITALLEAGWECERATSSQPRAPSAGPSRTM